MDIKSKIARYFRKSKRKYADAVDKLFDEIACDIDVLEIAYQKIKRPKAELNAYKPLVLEGYDYDYKFFSTFKLANFKFSEVRSTFYKKAALLFAQDKMYICEYVFSGISDYKKESYYEVYYNAINSVGIETEIAEYYEPDKEDKKGRKFLASEEHNEFMINAGQNFNFSIRKINQLCDSNELYTLCKFLDVKRKY